MVSELDGDLVVRMESRRGFYWGNFLLLAKAPEAHEVDRVIERFLGLFPRQDFGHIAIGWHESNLDATKPFLERGFHLDHGHVSSSWAVPEALNACAGLEVAEAHSSADGEATIQLALADREPAHKAEPFERFVRKQVETRRRQVSTGQLKWFVARLEGQVVGSMGLFLQDVVTHADSRGCGVCSTLLAEVYRRGLEELGATTLVLLADVGGPAWRIYEAHGFRATEAVCGVWMPPKL
ncbi:MAG: ribosomal protein S18 acetylase RimI-like enzyme [Bacteroidia bacterium]